MALSAGIEHANIIWRNDITIDNTSGADRRAV